MNSSHDDLERLIVVDDLCEEFRAEFAAGSTPRIDDYLKRVEAEHCSSVLRELVKLEAILRAEEGEQISAEKVLEQYSDLLSDAVDRGALKSDIEQALASTDARLGATTTAMFDGARDVESEPPLPSVEGYEIEGVLGRGGMGVVYKARQAAVSAGLVSFSEYDKSYTILLAAAEKYPDESGGGSRTASGYFGERRPERSSAAVAGSVYLRAQQYG